MRLLLMCAVGLTACTGCGQTDYWALVWRDTPSDASWQLSDIAGYYDSLEHCRAKGAGMLRFHEGAGEFLCGRDCKNDVKTGLQCRWADPDLNPSRSTPN